MAKQEVEVQELITMIERGELRLPEMQRRYVWRSTRVRDLFDSLYRGYPSGAILVWETDEDVPEQDFAIKQADAVFHSKRLLLDGQQRLTSLSAVIRGKPVEVRGRKKPIELLFNLDHPDQLSIVSEVNEDGDDQDDENEPDSETEDSSEDELLRRFNQMAFVVATSKLEQMASWVKVHEVFASDSDKQFLEKAGVTSFDHPKYDKYSQRLAKLRAIRKYSYRMDILERSLSYNEVTEIFVRVNSLGAKLRSSDLALAQITAKWHGALGIFQEFQKRCDGAGFPIELGVHLKNLVCFATGQSRFLTVGNLSVNQLKTGWTQSMAGMEFAMNFLRSNVHIESPLLLASPFILITVGYFGHQKKYKLSPKEEAWLKAWVLLANAKGRYSRGSSETILDQDITIIKNNTDPQELIDKLRQQVGRLDVEPDELEGRNQRSALFKTMFLAFREAGAKDWESSLTISLEHSGQQHKLEFHHIFPKAILKSDFTSREADDIANLAFIGGKTNRMISDKEPAEYMQGYITKSGELSMAAQCIPLRPDLHKTARYKEFLTERRKLISKRLSEFLALP